MVESLSQKRLDSTTCQKCNKICKSKQGLSNHRNTCLKSGRSFFKNESISLNLSENPKVGSLDDKVLPPSQPVNATVSTIPLNEVEETVDIINSDCSVCWECVSDESRIACEQCKACFHYACLHITDEVHKEHMRHDTPSWLCARCLSIRSNVLKWGNLEGETTIKNNLCEIYSEITGWHKNLFLVPRGSAGTEFIKELSKMINYFVNDTKWSRVAISMLHVFIPLLLQKPSQKAKAKENVFYLQKRLKWWRDGNLRSLVDECREIQARMKKTLAGKKESKEKAFCRLMLLGKVGEAMRFINNDDVTYGVHDISDEVKDILLQKHPSGKHAEEEIIPTDTWTEPQQVIYEEIDGDSVCRAAKKLHGSGGPTLLDADGWKHILCSKSYGKASSDLCESIANLAKKLCREDIHPDCLQEFLSCRLIPLDKGEDADGNKGIRPIGIGEILRRLVGKVIVETIKPDIIKAAGPLQTCAGLQSGIEASIHAMKSIFDEEDTEAILLVDADNAFNNLNRQAALKNIKDLCPPFYRFLHNTYQSSSTLYLKDNSKTDFILSQEGTTQGDVPAMGMYAVATRPLIENLHRHVDNSICKQVWFADDSTCGGKIHEMKRWWDKLNVIGPKYGYFPKSSKTILIVKNEEMLKKAEYDFAGSGVTITSSGERHLGAVIGSEEFRNEYVRQKVQSWVDDVTQLSSIAKDEPQLAYSAFTKALCMRWSFMQRTIPNIAHLFQPLEEAINDKLIPAIIGRKLSQVERRVAALPVRYGGLGIQNPTKSAQQEFETSTRVTVQLTQMIKEQKLTLDDYNDEEVKSEIVRAKKDKEKYFSDEFDQLKNMVSDEMKRNIALATEKGAGVWLTTIPIQSMGFVLNKQEFRDSIHLRYGWKIPHTPSHCNCGSKNSVDHTLNCKLGGYVNMRHNGLRNLEAEILKEICKDVKIEPELIPVGNTELPGSNLAEKARLDVSAVGLWSTMERTFVDVRVMHPNSPSYVNNTPQQLYAKHEKEKKRKYNQRVLQVEKGSFTPLIFTTTGGMGPEATRFHRRVAELIANKRNENFSHVMNVIRTKIRFCLLRSTLIAIRGERGRTPHSSTPLSEVSYNLMQSSE